MCLCHDPYSFCPEHHPKPTRISVNDRLAGCDCVEITEWTNLDGTPMVVQSVLCPVHGEPAYRS
jgi:hypothetical protein